MVNIPNLYQVLCKLAQKRDKLAEHKITFLTLLKLTKYKFIFYLNICINL